MKGLKKIAGESKDLKGYYNSGYLQLNYNKKTGEAWADYQVSIGHNSYIAYNDPDIIYICNIYVPITMAEIKNLIEQKLSMI